LASAKESITHTLVQLEEHLQSTATASAGAKLQKAKQSLINSGNTASPDDETIRKGIRADMLASEKLKALRIRR